jgi:hypothetical protein
MKEEIKLKAQESKFSIVDGYYQKMADLLKSSIIKINLYDDQKLPSTSPYFENEE